MAKVARLYEQFVPEHYQLHLDVEFEAFHYQGFEVVRFTLTRPSRQLVMHAVGLQVSLAALDQTKTAKTITMHADDQTVVMEFDAEIPAGSHELSLSFAGEISDSLHGFYRSQYLNDGKEKFLATTQFEAVHAREAFVCIDEPAAKAVFELALTVPERMSVIANTNITGEAPDKPGLKKVSFAPTPKMSTYLIAFIIGEFDYVEGSTPDGVVVRVYATPGKTSQLSFALDAAIRIIGYYNEYFAIPYPLSKLDMIAIPDFSAGAMENWGALTYRETALLIDPQKASLANKQRVAEVVAHELAHQWFGDLVTMSWWEDLWLNEGFATWVASLAMDKLWPEWHIWTQFIQEEFDQALGMDSLANTHPIQVEVEDPRALDEIFDAISYAKGASMLNMLHHYLGPVDFRSGLHEYLTRHSYGNAVTADLWKALEDASSKPVSKVMSAWTSRPGYPIVRYEGGRAAQSRFYSSPKEASKTKGADEPWPIPFDVQLAGRTTTGAQVEDQAEWELAIEITSSAWFKPNPGETAFYRSLYSAPMIAALTAPMQAGELVATDRFGIVADVFAATEAGLLDAGVALQLTAALRDESDYVVWSALSGGLGSLIGVIENEHLRERMNGFGHWLVSLNAERLGWEQAADEDTFRTLMRPIVLQQAVRFDDEATTKEAKRRFESYLEGAHLEPDIRAVVLYGAARHGGKAEFEAIRERYLKEDSPQVKVSLLASLGRFRKPELIRKFLAFGLSPDVRPQDIFIVIAWSFMNREGRELAWQWMQDNWEEFVRRYGAGGHMLERFPLYAASGFATHKMAREIGDFFTSHPHPSTKRPTLQAVESVEIKADWYERDHKKIEAFLEKWEAKSKPGS